MDDKPDQKRSTDQDHQIGGKKCHDKPEGIIQVIGRDQKLDSEKQDEATCDD